MLAPHHQRRIELVAYLYCSNASVRESKIAKDLGFARARVAEDLGIARKRGLVVQERRFISERMFDPIRLKALRLLHQGVALKKHLQRDSERVRDVFVLDSGEEESLPNRLVRMGSSAAPVVYDLLRKAGCVGVAWGGTVGAVVEALQGYEGLGRIRTKPIEFVPICGEPLRARRRINSATSLALELDQLVNGGMVNSRSLAGVPALIPRNFFEYGDIKLLKRFFQTATDYGAIFGGDVPGGVAIIDKMDMILTSVGTATDHWKMCDVELRHEAEGITKAELCRLAFGDIGGLLLPRPHLDAVEKENFEFLCEQWTGIRLAHYERVAKNCREHAAPGVVVVAIAGNKADVLYQGVKAGLINYIVCDHELATALAQLSKAPAIKELAKGFIAEGSSYVSDALHG